MIELLLNHMSAKHDRLDLFKVLVLNRQQSKYVYNQLNSVINGFGKQAVLRNHMPHIKVEETAKKLYARYIYGGHLGFLRFVHFLQKIARLSTYVVFLNICRDDFLLSTFYSSPYLIS